MKEVVCEICGNKMGKDHPMCEECGWINSETYRFLNEETPVQPKVTNANDICGETSEVYTKVIIVRQAANKLEGNLPIGKVQCIHEGTIKEIKKFWEHSPWKGAFRYEKCSKFEFERFHQLRKENEYQNIRLTIHIIETNFNYDGKRIDKELIDELCFSIGGDSFDPEEHLIEILSDYNKISFSSNIDTIENKLKIKQDFADKYFKDCPLMQEWAKTLTRT